MEMPTGAFLFARVCIHAQSHFYSVFATSRYHLRPSIKGCHVHAAITQPISRRSSWEPERLFGLTNAIEESKHHNLPRTGNCLGVFVAKRVLSSRVSNST